MWHSNKVSCSLQKRLFLYRFYGVPFPTKQDNHPFTAQQMTASYGYHARALGDALLYNGKPCFVHSRGGQGRFDERGFLCQVLQHVVDTTGVIL